MSENEIEKGPEIKAAASEELKKLIATFGLDVMKEVAKKLLKDDNEKEAIREKKIGVTIGELGVNMNMRIDGKGNVIEILEDIDVRGYDSMGEKIFSRSLDPLIYSGINVEYTPWRVVDGEDKSGEIYIKKDELNSAIKDGRIKIHQDKEGNFNLEILSK